MCARRDKTQHNLSDDYPSLINRLHLARRETEVPQLLDIITLLIPRPAVYHGRLSRSEFHDGQVPLKASGSCSW